MASPSKLEIRGQAPFKQSGVYEAQIAIVGSRPSDEQIKSKLIEVLDESLKPSNKDIMDHRRTFLMYLP